jgi:hypothetical protein
VCLRNGHWFLVSISCNWSLEQAFPSFADANGLLNGTASRQLKSFQLFLSQSHNTHLYKTNIRGLLTERLTAHVEPVLANYTCVLALAGHDTVIVSIEE